jgi:phosphoribosylaminoimidazole-succinocarboxamide synthase
MSPNQPLTSLPVPAHRGKVRDVYDLGENLLLVATDRVSAFDCVLPTEIPDKGKILTDLSAYWFERTAALVPSHMLSTSPADFPEPFRSEATLAGRSTLVRKARRIDVECVVRGYLAGAGWAEYERTGRLFGHDLPSGLTKGARLTEPLFTPTTKADEGHDEPLSFEDMADSLGAELAERLRSLSLTLYREGHAIAEGRGFLLADTKFEFGFIGDELSVIDEVLTPDSSRYWRKEDYRAGVAPDSWDKQVIRDYLAGLPWDKTPPAPPLPPEIVHRARERYLDVHRAITGRELPS